MHHMEILQTVMALTGLLLTVIGTQALKQNLRQRCGVRSDAA